MIGRGARGNPWIFNRSLKLIKEGLYTQPPDIGEVLTMIRRHTDLCIRHKGESVAIREMRKHVGWYLKGFKKRRRREEMRQRGKDPGAAFLSAERL